MNVVRTGAQLREVLGAARVGGKTVGFVPTMGALHAGHVSLLRAARSENDVVVVSIFVNPLQFGAAEDLSSYPRREQEDLSLAAAEGADICYVPTADEMYPPGRSTTVRVGRISSLLEGEKRPGHFEGVATVVAKLFNQVTPDRAYFGQKDAQQVAVIKKMVAELSFPVDVVVCPTIREPDGLAMSSRNAYLDATERRHATVLWRALQAGRDALGVGAGPDVAEKTMEQTMASEPGVEVDYARVVDPHTFQTPSPDAPSLLVVAARVGPARLIDNLLVQR